MQRIDLERAFVVHSYPYRETSALLELLTCQHGRVGIVARGVKRAKSPLRVLLQPFAPLLVSFSMRGDLGTLRAAERAHTLPPLSGSSLIAAMYLNELVMRTTHRHDPHPGLFDAYAFTVESLASFGVDELLLRRFEKRLLDEVGYGLMLDHDASSGEAIDPSARYRYHVQRGPERDDDASSLGVSVQGTTLLALANESALDQAGLREAKLLMRAEIDAHLGNRPLLTRAIFR